MKYLRISAALFTAAFFTSCDNIEGENSNISRIEGRIQGANEVYISEINTDGQNILDTIALQDEEFEYELEVDSSNFYHIGSDHQASIAFYMNPGDEVKITSSGSAEDLDYSVEGNEESRRIREIYGIIQKAMHGKDSLDQVAATYADSANFDEVRNGLMNTYNELITEARNDAKSMIDEDPGNITNIFIFPLRIGQVPLIPAEDDFEYFEKTQAAILEQNPGNPHAEAFVKRVDQFQEALAQQKQLEETRKTVAPGSVAPDIELPDPDGNMRKLSDLRGKVVLIDFWAAWCKPCRMANPNLVRVYNQFKDQGFEIFSVSLDGLPQQSNAREAWIGAIEQDGLVWKNHVSDLQGWNSEVVRTYGFDGIPYTVLIDREGKIITTQLHGPMLEQQLQITLKEES